MPTNVGLQVVSLQYGAPGNSVEINRRFVCTQPTGIYSGGILTVSDGSHANISPLICEISDGSYQVRIQTTLTVNLAVASGTSYVILRWSYSGQTDYMELLAVTSGSVLATDVVVGRCIFAAGSLTGFDYGDSIFPRTVSSTHDLCLKVVPTIGTTLKALVMPGWTQGQQEKTFVPMQETSALVAPVSNPKIYLVVLSEDGVVSIDSTGTEAATPAAPNYNGRNILAEITLSPGDTSITSTKIQDVRMFVSGHAPNPDEVTITTNVAGELKAVDPNYIVLQDDTEQAVNQLNWTKLTFDFLVKSSIITESAGVITLPASKLYKMSYCIQFTGALTGNYHLEVQSRLRVLSGDISWEFKDDSNNVSWQRIIEYGYDYPVFRNTLAGTYLILPASSTTIQLEVKTKGTIGLLGRVIHCSLSIWT